MSDPALDLQGAVVATLKADTGVKAIVGARVFDRVDPASLYPYVALGEDQVLSERADGYDGSDVRMTIHAFSRAVGFPEVKRLAGAIRAALNLATLALVGTRVVEIAFLSTTFVRDPDGLTSHAVLTFQALTEPAD